MGWGGMTSHLAFRVQMFIMCFQKSPKTTLSRLFRGVGWVCIFLELDRAIEIIFGKLLGEIEFEFLRNLKYLVEFEERARIRKKGSSRLRPRPRSTLQIIFRFMYSRNRISQYSFPNFIYIFPKSFFIYLSRMTDRGP